MLPSLYGNSQTVTYKNHSVTNLDNDREDFQQMYSAALSRFSQILFTIVAAGLALAQAWARPDSQ
jgi:hypothetical protein